MLLEHERYYGLGMDALRLLLIAKVRKATGQQRACKLESLKTLKSSRKPTAPRARLTNY